MQPATFRVSSRSRDSLALAAVHGVRIERLVGVAEFEHERLVGRLAERHRAIEARAPAGVTGARPLLPHLDPDGVLIAIDPQLDHALDMAGALALAPQPPARAAEVPGLAAFDRARERLGAHVRD